MTEQYIIIKTCKVPTWWYADKIGFTFKVDSDVKFPDVYTIRTSKRKDRANYGNVDMDDAEIVTPNLMQKMALKMGWTR